MLAARLEQKNGMTKGRQKWRDAPLTKKAPYKPDAGNLPVDCLSNAFLELGNRCFRVGESRQLDTGEASAQRVTMQLNKNAVLSGEYLVSPLVKA